MMPMNGCYKIFCAPALLGSPAAVGDVLPSSKAIYIQGVAIAQSMHDDAMSRRTASSFLMIVYFNDTDKKCL